VKEHKIVVYREPHIDLNKAKPPGSADSLNAIIKSLGMLSTMRARNASRFGPRDLDRKGQRERQTQRSPARKYHHKKSA
jgi:hypothetical protein